jgi:hypothetical protein
VLPVVKPAKLGVFNTPKKGWALKSLEEIDQGRLVEEVVGEMLTVTEAASRLITPKRRATAKTPASHFLLSVGFGLYLDLTDKASLSRFVNHSCSPNCEFQVWDVFGEKRVGLFALKPIRKDTELTVDYSMTHVGEKGVENQCESRGGKTHKELPFREYVDQVLKAAANSKTDSGVATDEAKMQVHAEDEDDAEKETERNKETSKAGGKREQNAEPAHRNDDGNKRTKTGQSASASAPGVAGGGGRGSPKTSPLLSAQSAQQLKSASFSLHDAVISCPCLCLPLSANLCLALPVSLHACVRARARASVSPYSHAHRLHARMIVVCPGMLRLLHRVSQILTPVAHSLFSVRSGTFCMAAAGDDLRR